MKIILLIRRSANYWIHGNLDYSISDKNRIHRIISATIKSWNYCFGMQYMDFRKRVREIAFKTMMQNSWDDVLMYYDMERYHVIPDGDLIVPVDEDDWFSPNLVKELRKIEDPYKTIYWDGDRKLSRYEPDDHKIEGTESCTYGVKKPVSFKLVKYHTKFVQSEAYHLNKVLAYKHTNASSLSLLYEMFFKDKFLIDLVEDVVGEIGNFIYPAEYKKYGEEYEELLKEWISSAKFKMDGQSDWRLNWS